MRFSNTRVEAAISLRAKGLSIPEIAASLKIHRRTVNKLLSKARTAEDDAPASHLQGETRHPVPDDLIPETPLDAIEALQAATMIEIGRIAAEQAADHAVHPDLIGRTAAALAKISTLSRQIRSDAAAAADAAPPEDYAAMLDTIQRMIDQRAKEYAAVMLEEEAAADACGSDTG